MEELLEEPKRKKYNKFQWFIAVILIPTIFALIVAAIVASFAGVDVWGKAKEFSEKIPLIASDEEKNQQEKMEEMEKSMVDLNAEIQFRDDTILQLETEIDRKEQEIEALALEIEQLELQMKDIASAGDSGNHSQTMKEITRTFENMSAKKAAPIIVSMSENDAIVILSSLKSDTLAGLLENMNPDVAAKFTTLLSNRVTNGLNQ